MSDPRLLLIGGGHAHVAVIASGINWPFGAQVTLVTPHPTLRYSGMVPGWIAGHHERGDGLVDLAALASRAGVELMLDRCTGLDPDRRVAFTEGGQEIAFDIASVDSGGVGRAKQVLGADPRLVDVRPIDAFVDCIAALPLAPRRIAVIGGGAGGVELAFGFRASGGTPDVVLVTGSEGLLPGFATGVAKRVQAEIERQGIALIEADASFEDDRLMAQEVSLEPLDLIVAALGSAAPEWPRASGLACDTAGFIKVDRYQRSTCHPHIFAAGDVAARTDRVVEHSGVHAVHTGPILGANLRLALAGEKPEHSYTPRPASLYLLATGDGGAIASYGSFAIQGKWVGRLKRWIDRRWIDKYAKAARRP